VNPLNMKETGPLAFHATFEAVRRALQREEEGGEGNLEMLDEKHYVCYIDCSKVVDPDVDVNIGIDDNKKTK
jgi:hypothetical protein